jgi:hypothetical protein
MYINGKLSPTKTVPETGEGGIKENDGEGNYNYDKL